MCSLSDSQIDFILNDIGARGVKTEDLQYNLLDHICCIIENELGENEDFGQFYNRIITRFFKKELSELEEETQLLLTFKHYYTMKKIMFVSGFTSALMMLCGAMFKIMHWPGANVLVLFGAFFFSLLFLPLMFTLKIKERKEKRDKGVLLSGLLISLMLLSSAVFKFFHWPWAEFIGIVSICVLLLLFIPFYLFSGLRNPETKTNTIVTTILMIAGCAFLLVLPGRKSKTLSDAEIAFLRNEQAALQEFQRLTKGDSSAFKELLQLNVSAERLKDAIARGISGVGYREYLNGADVSPTYLTGEQLAQYPELKNFIEALLIFESSTKRSLFESGTPFDDVESRQNEFRRMLVGQKSIQGLISSINLMQTTAHLFVCRARCCPEMTVAVSS